MLIVADRDAPFLVELARTGLREDVPWIRVEDIVARVENDLRLFDFPRLVERVVLCKPRWVTRIGHEFPVFDVPNQRRKLITAQWCVVPNRREVRHFQTTAIKVTPQEQDAIGTPHHRSSDRCKSE